MAQEIERKFLVSGDAWRNLAEPIHYRQGYLSTQKDRIVRVRIVGEKGYLTIKGLTHLATRLEYEYEIPYTEAVEILEKLCEQPIIEKKRYTVCYRGHYWEIDEFEGVNKGLILAEEELSHPDESIEIPDWIGEEVTGDPKYFNSNLVKHPYTIW